MCVNTMGYSWERPAVQNDCSILEKYFPEVDFVGFLKTMSQDEAKPLTTDLALIGAMVHTNPDELGMRAVPFSGIHQITREVVKLPVMDQIVDWFENSALGTDMWMNASELSEKLHDGSFHFAMQCNCGLVASSAKQKGDWNTWKVRFNQSRADIFGRSRVIRRETNSLENLDITQDQLEMWLRIRTALEALPRIERLDKAA